MSQSAFFEPASGTVIGREVLHDRFRPKRVDDAPMEAFALPTKAFDEAMRRRVAASRA